MADINNLSYTFILKRALALVAGNSTITNLLNRFRMINLLFGYATKKCVHPLTFLIENNLIDLVTESLIISYIKLTYRIFQR